MFTSEEVLLINRNWCKCELRSLEQGNHFLANGLHTWEPGKKTYSLKREMAINPEQQAETCF